MSRNTPWLLAGLLLALAVMWAGRGQVLAQGEPLPSNTGPQLETALRAQVEALNAEDPERMMALVHPQAPNFAQLRASLVGMFRETDTRYTLDAFHYVAAEGPYAYARGRQSTTQLYGPKPSQSVSEQLFVFRRHADGWKFWTSVVLEQQAGRRR